MFDSTKAESIWTEDLLRHLHAMSEAPWCEYGRQRKPITARQLGALLKPFGIVAGQVGKEETNKRGYTSEQFSSAWGRYLSASPLEATESASFSDFPSARDDQPLADGNPPKAAETASSSTLADSDPQRPVRRNRTTDPRRPRPHGRRLTTAGPSSMLGSGHERQLLKLCDLWERERRAASGQPPASYLVGVMGGLKVLVFDRHDPAPGEPVATLFVAEPTPRQSQQDEPEDSR